MMLESTNVLILDESITSLHIALVNFLGDIIFTSLDFELNKTVANRVIEIFENGTIVDRRVLYEEYIQDKKIKELREKNRISKK